MERMIIFSFWASECVCECVWVCLCCHATRMWSLFVIHFHSLFTFNSTLSSHSYPKQLRRNNIFIGNQLHSFLLLVDLWCAYSVIAFYKEFAVAVVVSSLEMLFVWFLLHMCMCVMRLVLYAYASLRVYVLSEPAKYFDCSFVYIFCFFALK